MNTKATGSADISKLEHLIYYGVLIIHRQDVTFLVSFDHRICPKSSQQSQKLFQSNKKGKIKNENRVLLMKKS